MRLSNKVLLGLVLLALVLTIFSITTYASKDDSHYYSYTKAIKYCGQEGCMMQDFIVQCNGNRVIDVKPLIRRFYVPNSFEWDDPLGWCES